MTVDRATRNSSRFRAPEALLRGSGGFSLVELIVVMAIFIIVIIAASNAFNTLVTHSVQQTKLAESQTGGVIGLEMMRADLEHAGYGLPWSFQNNFTYTEPNDLGAGLSDAPSGVPRAVHSGDNQGPAGSDRLVIRSTVAGTEPTAKKWTYATYSSVGSVVKTWNTTEDLAAGERIIVVRATNVDGIQGKQLIVSSAGAFFTNYPPAGDFRPQSQSDLHLVYGLRPAGADVVRPFNRVDYYLGLPENPELFSRSCAPNTHTLFKGVVNHSGADVTPYPLLDCVADLQVIFGVDTSGDGEVDMHLNEVSASAQEIRDQVKEVRVYILAQEGKKDRSFRYPNQKVRLGDFDSSLGSEFDLATIGADWRNYRWRVYTVVVNPKNLAN